MANIANLNIDYNRPVKIAEGIYWIGFSDKESGLHCNPYLIVEGDEAVVIDGGSRPDFPTVMMKVLQTGVNPSSIKALIYQHFDPDLCGSLPDFEDIIGRDDLEIISEKSNNVFIRHYFVSSKLLAIDDMGCSFKFASGREFQFIKTPYAHAAGSFVTFDKQTGTLFTSDLFGSYGLEWELFLNLGKECRACSDYDNCPNGRTHCPLQDILNFHRKLMPSERILKWAMEQIAGVPFSMIAPQHGSVIYRPDDLVLVCEKLASLKGVGIDGITENKSYCELGDIECIKERFADK